MTRPPTLFQEEWWLQAAAGPDLEQVEVKWAGKTVGALFFVRYRRFGLRQIEMPPYTRTLGPVFSLPPESAAVRARHIQRVTADLVARLPPHDRFRQVLDPHDPSVFGFSQAGYALSIENTFRLTSDRPANEVWDFIGESKRNVIRRREQDTCIETHENIERFLDSITQAFGSHRHAYDFVAIRRIFAACLSRGCVKIFSAVDAAGRDVAAAVLVWGAGVLYFWLTSRDRAAAAAGAKTLIAWRAINFALSNGLAFDFDSYASQSGGQFVSAFVECPIYRPVVMNLSARARFAYAFRGQRIK